MRCPLVVWIQNNVSGGGQAQKSCKSICLGGVFKRMFKRGCFYHLGDFSHRAWIENDRRGHSLQQKSNPGKGEFKPHRGIKYPHLGRAAECIAILKQQLSGVDPEYSVTRGSLPTVVGEWINTPLHNKGTYERRDRTAIHV